MENWVSLGFELSSKYVSICFIEPVLRPDDVCPCKAINGRRENELMPTHTGS